MSADEERDEKQPVERVEYIWYRGFYDGQSRVDSFQPKRGVRYTMDEPRIVKMSGDWTVVDGAKIAPEAGVIVEFSGSVAPQHVHSWRIPDGPIWVTASNPPQYPWVCDCGARKKGPRE